MHHLQALFGKELYMFRIDLLLIRDSKSVRHMYIYLLNKVRRWYISLFFLWEFGVGLEADIFNTLIFICILTLILYYKSYIIFKI